MVQFISYRVNCLALKYLNERKQKQNYINSDRTSREISTTLSSNFEYTESPMLIDHHESSTDRQVVVNPFVPTVPTCAVRETASLGIMGAPRVPPLNPSESIVLSEHYRL